MIEITLEELATMAGLAATVLTGLGFVVRFFYKKFVDKLDETKAALCKDIHGVKEKVDKIDQRSEATNLVLANHLIESKGGMVKLELIEKLVIGNYTVGAPFPPKT